MTSHEILPLSAVKRVLESRRRLGLLNRPSTYQTPLSAAILPRLSFSPLKSFTSAPIGAVTVGPTMPHGPGAVMPFNNELPDHIVKSPFLARRQIAPPAASET